MRPGVNVTTSTSIPPNVSPTNTGTWFVSGFASQGPNTPVKITNFAQYVKVFGERGTYSSILYDSIEQFFSEGGGSVYVIRPIPASAALAEEVFKGKTETGKTALKIKANGVGTWGNSLKVKAAASGSGVVLTIKLGTVEVISPVLLTFAEIVTWAATTQYITVVGGEVSELPKAEEISLKSGVNGEVAKDTAAKEATTYATALALFTEEYGPGQISVPGGSISVNANAELTKVIYEAATKQNRRAVTDMPLVMTKAEGITQGEAIAAYGEAARNGAAYASWQTIPPALGLVTTRTVPSSPFVAAKANAIDGQGNPNIPIAGKNGIIYNSLSQSTSFNNLEIEELYTAGINVSKVVNGQIRIYGNRTGVKIETEPLYVQFSNSRLDMAIIWNALSIEQEFYGSQLDGEGRDTSLYGNLLGVMMLGYYKVGAVYGAKPSEAYSVDAGSDVNTPATEAEGNLNATIAVRRSPGAEQVNLNIVRVGITQQV